MIKYGWWHFFNLRTERDLTKFAEYEKMIYWDVLTQMSYLDDYISTRPKNA